MAADLKKYYEILGVKNGASRAEIRKAYFDLAKKKHPDKIKQSLKREATDDETEEFQKIEQAYKILIGEESPPNSGGGGGPRSNEPRYDTCDYCEKKYDFDRENYHQWKTFVKKNRETETFHFCNKKRATCYNNFFFCYYCEKPRTERNKNDWLNDKGKIRTKKGVFLCSDDCLKKFNNEGCDPGQENGLEKYCYKCGNSVGENKLVVEGMGYICISCATKKCKYCDKQGLPIKGSGWQGYEGIGWFCCREHYEKWKKDNQNQEQGNEEEIPKPPITPPTNGNERGGKRPKPNSNNNSDNIPNQEGEDNNNLPQNIKSIANLPLPQAQEAAEQEIEKLLKSHGISYQELDTKDLSGESNWKDYLRTLDSPQKVADFTYQMQQAILKKALAKKETTATENKKPKNDLVLPIVISVFCFLLLSTLIIIVRKKRQRGF